MWLILSVNEPLNLNKLIKMPQEAKTKKKKREPPRGRLTAGSLVRPIRAVFRVVALVFPRDAGAIAAAELITGACPSSWGQITE